MTRRPNILLLLSDLQVELEPILVGQRFHDLRQPLGVSAHDGSQLSRLDN